MRMIGRKGGDEIMSYELGVMSWERCISCFTLTHDHLFHVAQQVTCAKVP
jgi:hypothetical protein